MLTGSPVSIEFQPNMDPKTWQDRYCRKASEYEVFITYFSCDTVFVLKEYSTMSTYTALRIPCIAFFHTLNYGQCLRICKKVIKQQHCSGRVNHPVKKGKNSMLGPVLEPSQIKIR